MAVRSFVRQRPSPHSPCRNVAFWWAITLSLLALGGCGFHLRGSVILPADVNTLHLQVPNAELAEEIKLLLGGDEVSIVPTAENADLTLIVAPERLDRRLVAVDPQTGKAREFELTYTTSFQVLGKQGKIGVPPQTVNLSRELVFDPEAVIGTSREEEVIYSEMRRDAARQIMARIQAALSP
jgi:LPS-assembly lipoprotein